MSQQAGLAVKVYSWQELHERTAAQTCQPALRLTLVRHGETETNALNLISGSLEVDLTAAGRDAAVRLGWDVAANDEDRQRWDAVWCSGLGRSYETARLVLSGARRFDLLERIERDARLDECDFGALEGRRARPLEAFAAGDLNWAAPGGESYMDVTQRVLSFLVDLRSSTDGGARVLICSHMGPMRLMVGILAGLNDAQQMLSQRFDNSAAYDFDLKAVKLPVFAYGHSTGIEPLRYGQ